MSRRPLRATAAKRRRAKRPNADERIVARPDAVDPELAAPDAGRGAVSRVTRPPEARIWTALLVGGAAVAVGLLGRQVADLYADRSRPALFQNDLFSALGSVAMLAIVAAFAWHRRRANDRGSS
ncbi:MAG: hypothetical protein NVS2B3_17570 [Vulcanimicrobiaceae bacterium]